MPAAREAGAQSGEVRMSEGRNRRHGGATEIDADADPVADHGTGAAGEGLKGGWQVLPPGADAVGPAAGRRLRAPWATRTAAPEARPAPASDATPASGAKPAAGTSAPATNFTSKSWSVTRPAAGPAGGGPATPKAPPAPPTRTRAAAEAAPSPAGGRALAFTGSAGEYFRVWIVNVCLTVLTLGIYSAWAKVRTQRYLYRHTVLEGSPFDYLADPVKILKGRAAVILFLGAYVVLGRFLPPVQGLMAIALVFLVPWAVVKSLRFRAQNAAWRNIRFGFDGTYKEALAVFIGWPIAVAFTLGLAYPYYQWRRARFVAERSRFGTAPFTWDATPGEFYRIQMRVAGIVLLMVALAAGAAAVLYPVVKSGIGLGAPPLWAAVAVNVAGSLAYLVVWAYARARTWNLTWNRTAVGPHHFECTARARDLFRLYLMNTLGIVVSLGLLVPWARVRMAKYRVEHLHVTGGAAIAEFAQGQAQAVGATGAELGEVLDLDLSL